MTGAKRTRARAAAWLAAGLAVLLLGFPAAAQEKEKSPPAKKESASEQSSKQPEALLHRSTVEALKRKDCATAAKELEEFLLRQSGHQEAMFHLAFCYSELGRRARAARLYRELLELNPAMIEARVNLGVLLIEQKKPREAAEQFQKATELQPNKYRTLLYYAMALEESQEVRAATEQYALAAEADPKALEPRRALVQLIRGQKDGASYAPLLEKLTGLFPADAGLVELRADLLRAGEKPEEILALYERYFAAAAEQLSVPPKEVARLRYQAGLLAQELGRLDEALRHHTLAGEVAGKEFEWASLYGRARVLAAMERYGEAVPLYRKVVSLMGDDVDVKIYADLGFLLYKLKRYREAVPVLVQVINADPKREEAFNQLAWALHSLENYRGTLEVLVRRAQVREENPGTLFLRAISHDRLSECIEAIAYYEQFLALNTDRRSDQYFQGSARLRALKKSCKKRR